jgi:hypothetical protein
MGTSLAGISTVGFDDKRTQGAMRGANPENFQIFFAGHALREPKRFIYVHTVAKRSFGPLTRTLFPWLKLRGCEEGQRYVTCCAIGDPIPQASPDQERGGTRIDEHDGWRAAIDLLNPANITFDPFTGSNNPDFFANRSGQNLIAEGFWPSLNETPAEPEIKRAEQNRDARYRYLTREATRLAAVSTKDLNEFLQSYPDTHIAMDALGMSANWHTLSVINASCPNCGDVIKQGIAFHQSSAGILCIIDAAKAYKAGAINRERYEELAGSQDEDEAEEVPHRGGWPKGKPRKQPQ